MLFLAVLPITILAGDLSPSVRARAVAAADALTQQEPPEKFTKGIPWTGAPGITETVDEIMAREASGVKRAETAVFSPRELKPRLVAPAKIQDDASAAAVSRWPLPGEPRRGDAAPLPDTPQTVGTSFLGPRLSESGFIPPDSMGAVGPSQVLVIANGRIKVFDKSGVLGGLNATTDTFFTSVRTASTSDPHVRYDRLSGRWFVTMIDVASVNRVLIAVSNSSTITNTSSFTFFSFQHDLVGTTPNADTGLFADYDTLGVDKFALYVGVNMFTSADAFRGTTGFVINKTDLLAGTLTVTPFRQLAGFTCPSTGVYTPQGINNDDPQATEGYFIGVDVCTFSKLVLRRIINPGGTPSISDNVTLTVPTTTFPILQVHAGAAANRRLDALDDRLFAASIHTNAITGAKTLWTAHNIEVNSSGVGTGGGGRNGARWYEIGNLATTPTLVQSGTLFDSATTNPFGFWIPSVAMSGQGHMALGSSRASADPTNGFASIAAAGRSRTDPLGTIQAPTLAQSSTFAYNVQAVDGQRWGDYSQVVVDPNDNQTMWTFQEYADATNSWGVRAIQLKAPPPATPAVATPATVASGQASVNVTIDGTSLSGSEFFDPGPDTGGPGFLNHIAASISGVTVNTVTFVSPTQVTLNISTVGATAGAKDVTITNPDGQSRTGVGLLTVTSTSSFTLTVTVRGSASGTVTSNPAGISCTIASICITSYASGTPVTLTEAPGSGASFKQWGGACSGTATTCPVTMNANQSVTATFSQVFTDPTLTAQSTLIKAVHFTELRSAINTLRAVNSLAAFGWTDPTLTAGTTSAKKVHMDELRQALNEAGGPSPSSYETLVVGQTTIKASHISDLRNAVRALE